MANFIVSGVLVIAGAMGVRRAIHPGRAGTRGPILLALYGIGLLGAGAFSADPGQGFPPGTAVERNAISTAGVMHFVFGGIGFYALIGACFVFARRFAAAGERGWAAYSIASGILFFTAFAAIASGRTSPAPCSGSTGVLWIWTWHMLVHRKIAAALS